MAGRRWPILAAGAIVVALAWTQAPPVGAGRADAAPPPAQCPPGWEPVGPGPGDGSDANVAVFAGGDLRVGGGAAEAEGVVVALGDAIFDRTSTGTYNVGSVGVGSGVWPPAGSDMLLVGGDLDVGARTTLDVGSGIGGSVRAVGAAGPLDRIRTNGGTVSAPDAGAVDDWAGFGDLLRTRSQSYASLGATGTVVDDGATVTFTGDGTSARQVFDVDGDALGTSGSTRGLRFAGVPADAIVVVNVRGPSAALWFNALIGDDGLVVDPSNSQAFVDRATRTLWNLPDAQDVQVAGSAQLPGSILVPAATATTTVTAPGTNGRVYVGGDLVHAGDGSELHGYPFLGDDAFGCRELPDDAGGLAVSKVVTDPDGVADPDQVFTGRYRCLGRAATPAGTGTWSVRAGQTVTVATGLPLGASCTVREDAPSSPDGDHAWAPATVTPASVRIRGAAEPVVLTVANVLERRPPATLSLAKRVDGPADAWVADRRFTLAYRCTAGAADQDGEVELRGDGAPATVAVVRGATCTVTEAAPPPAASGWGWDAPRWEVDGSPRAAAPDGAIRVTVPTDGTEPAVRVVVTNPLEDDGGGASGGGQSGDDQDDGDGASGDGQAGDDETSADASGPGLPETGADAASMPLAVTGLALVVVGAAVVAVGRVRPARRYGGSPGSRATTGR